MNPDHLRKMLDVLEKSSPVGGWRMWSKHDVEDWPNHALSDLIMETLPTMVGAEVPPRLAQVAVGRLEFLHLLISHDAVGARRFLCDLARGEI
jgi:hypothetical protein